MGLYINSPNETKEQFLEREGLEVPVVDWENIPSDSLPVILMDNGMFTAAGIGFCEKEYNLLNDRKKDLRPKKIFIVKKDKIKATGVELPDKKSQTWHI